MAKGRDPSAACYSVTPDNFNPLRKFELVFFRKKNNLITVTRFLRNFEAPFVSLSTANQKYNENGHYNFLCIRYAENFLAKREHQTLNLNF